MEKDALRTPLRLRPRLRSVALLAIHVLLVGSAAHGSSLRALNPFDLMSEARVSVFLGEAIGDAEHPNLWEGYEGRRDALSVVLEREIERVLSAKGIAVRADAEDLVEVGIWGHQQALDSGGFVHVYSVELTIVDFDWRPESPCEDQRDLSQDSKAIGIASNSDLESVLKFEVLRLLDEELSRAAR